MQRPVRVLHVIDGLGGGGSEKLLYDIVRLSNPDRTIHRVITIFPDRGDFFYGRPLQELGVFSTPVTNPTPENALSEAQRPLGRAPASSFKSRVKRMLKPWFVPDSAPLSIVRRTLESRLILVTGRLARFLPRAYAEFRRFQPDVIHAHVYEGLLGGLCLKTMFRRPLVYLVPSWISQMRDAGFNWVPSVLRTCHGMIDRVYYGPGFEDELRSVGISVEKAIRFDGALDLEACHSVRSRRASHRLEIRKMLGLAQDALIGLSVGRLHSSKGHHYSAEAVPKILERFPNYHWVLLGVGDERERLETQIRDSGVERNSHFVGFVKDPLPFYAAADVYLRTPLFEGENLSSYLAMSQGLPVVGFETGCANDLIGIVGHGWHVKVGDVDALADRVCSTLALSDRGASIGLRGLEHCDAHLDIRQALTELEAAYSEICTAPEFAR